MFGFYHLALPSPRSYATLHTTPHHHLLPAILYTVPSHRAFHHWFFTATLPLHFTPTSRLILVTLRLLPRLHYRRTASRTPFYRILHRDTRAVAFTPLPTSLPLRFHTLPLTARLPLHKTHTTLLLRLARSTLWFPAPAGYAVRAVLTVTFIRGLIVTVYHLAPWVTTLPFTSHLRSRRAPALFCGLRSGLRLPFSLSSTGYTCWFTLYRIPRCVLYARYTGSVPGYCLSTLPFIGCTVIHLPHYAVRTHVPFGGPHISTPVTARLHALFTAPASVWTPQDLDATHTHVHYLPGTFVGFMPSSYTDFHYARTACHTHLAIVFTRCSCVASPLVRVHAIVLPHAHTCHYHVPTLHTRLPVLVLPRVFHTRITPPVRFVHATVTPRSTFTHWTGYAHTHPTPSCGGFAGPHTTIHLPLRTPTFMRYATCRTLLPRYTHHSALLPLRVVSWFTTRHLARLSPPFTFIPAAHILQLLISFYRVTG